MPETETTPLSEALARVVGRTFLPPTDIHVNLVMDADMAKAIAAVQDDLGAQGARSNRSEAMRLIMTAGIAALYAEQVVPQAYNKMKAGAVRAAVLTLAESQG